MLTSNKLIIYPGCQEYTCWYCYEVSVPRTFIAGHPVCSSCTDAKELNPVPLPLTENPRVVKTIRKKLFSP